MTGLAVTGYGAGALLMGPIAARELFPPGCLDIFAFGIAYFVGVIATAQFYANPPAGWKPAGWVPKTAVSKAAGTYDYTVKEALEHGRPGYCGSCFS